MTLQNDQDPGWWHRGMSKRAIVIVVSVSVAVIVVALLIMVVNGISFF